MAEKITGKAAQFVFNAESLYRSGSDLSLVKEVTRYEDDEGNIREERSIRTILDQPRKFYLTKKGMRNHEQKKGNERMENLDAYECTQSALATTVNRALNYPCGERPVMSRLGESQYLYGSDVNITTIIKHDLDELYTERYGLYKPFATRAMLDYETDMNYGTEAIIMGSLTMEEDVYLAVTRDYIEGIAPSEEEVTRKFLTAADDQIKEYIEARNITFHVSYHDNEMGVVEKLMGKAHELQPDFLAIWNMKFDIVKMLDACERYGVDPADIFCDPSIPDEFRRFKWQMANQKKEKADGSVQNKDPSDLWHYVDCLASFYIVDAMCLFRTLRAVEQMRASFSLDAILDEMLNISKLKWTGADHITPGSPEWHRFMQAKLPDPMNRLMYMVYCCFDCVSMELLDDKTKDIKLAILTYAGISELKRIKSNPRRLCDDYGFYLQKEYQRVICSTSGNMTEEFDKHTLGKREWIITLCNSLARIGSKGIYVPGYDQLEKRCRIFRYVWDIDISSSYPSNQLALNMDRGTTLAEVVSIGDLSEKEQRRISVNMTNVPSNAVDVAHTVLGMDNLTTLSTKFEDWKASKAA